MRHYPVFAAHFMPLILLGLIMFSGFARSAPAEDPLIAQLEQIISDPSLSEGDQAELRARFQPLIARLRALQQRNQGSTSATVQEKPTFHAPHLEFECFVEGTRNKKHLKLQVFGCRTLNNSGVTAQALNGKVFKDYSLSASGEEDDIKDTVAKSLARHVEKNDLNSSGNKPAVFRINRITLEDVSKGEKGKDKVTGHLEGEVDEFVGEVLPITDTDKKVLPIMFNIRSYLQAKTAILKDLDIMSHINQNLNIATYDFTDEENWPISLGAGHGSRAFFELFKNYYDKFGPGKGMVHRTTNMNSRWVNSRFEGQYSHKIETLLLDIGLEYYYVPGSFIFVYRMIPPGANPADVSNYAVATAAPPIWRASFSVHQYNSKDVESSFAVDKRYAAALMHVIKNAHSTSYSPNAFGVEENWSPYSARFWVMAPKLY